MKWITLPLWLMLFNSTAQKIDFTYFEYRYHLRFELTENTEVIPYCAQWSKFIPLNGEPALPLEHYEGNNYWFDYAPRTPALYSDGFPHRSSSFSARGRSLRTMINCSKIINAKDEEVYIYFTIICGPDSLEQMNPCLAFDGIENSNTPDYWDPVGFLNDTILSISYTDLEKGTYFFNWFDATDPLNKQLSALWKAKLHYNNELRNLRRKDDSLRQLFRTTGNREFLNQANSWSMKPAENRYEEQKMLACKNIIALGYANESFFNEQRRLKTEIRKEALLSHKVDNRTISPVDLNKYLALPANKRPKTAQKILAVFVEE